MSTSPPLLLPEVPSSRTSGRPHLTPASSTTSASSENANVLTRLASPGSEDDPVISMPILHPNDTFEENDASVISFKDVTREIFMDNVIENLVESYRRRGSTPTVPDTRTVKKSALTGKKGKPSVSSTAPSPPDPKDDSLEDVYVEWPRTFLVDESQENDFRISDENAVLCALSIPEEFVPTPHQDFIKDLDNRTCKKEKMLLSTTGQQKCLSQNGHEGVVKTEPGPGGENSIAKETDRKLRSAFAKYKKWDEAERSKIEKLGDNKILVNGSVTIEIDYTNYVREEDVVLELDEDWKTCTMPPLPNPTAPNCQAHPCRLGCICSSITQDSAPRIHCGKAKCLLECTCQQAPFANEDDGDIRSRLRPRVSLLNWRYLESAEREKDPPVNYRQLERGAAIYPRMRRVPVAPKRFRNEYILAHKFKDTFGRERRKTVPGLKFLRNKQVVKRDNRTNIYRRNFPSNCRSGKMDESLPTKMGKVCKPCTVTIDNFKTPAAKRQLPVLKPKPTSSNQVVVKSQPPLPVPSLIQVILEDGQIMLLGLESMCFFAWTVHAKQPKAVIYDAVKGDMMPIPWLYLPVPNFGEVWIFHQVSESLRVCEYVSIPEINCIIPCKALQMHFNIAHSKKKGVALDILYIGEDSKGRSGKIYIFPQIPGVIVCGPFPKTQIRSRTAVSTKKMPNALKIGEFLDVLMKKRYMGDNHSWNSFFSSNSHKALNAVKENLLKPKEPITISDDDDDDDVIPEEEFMKMIPGFVTQTTSSLLEVPTIHLPKPKPKPLENLRVSWTDAARILAVRPQMKM